jgi:glutathione-regulated potassium-efflux system ancillary protein KefF
MIVVIYAHPYPTRSRAGRSMLDAIRDLPDVSVRSLYDLYPDFDIDVEAEQKALGGADLIVWLHPFYWYSVPGMMKHWFDKVLEQGWAYGEGGTALAGKQCLWAVTVGSAEGTYCEVGENLRTFPCYTDPLEQTARFCGMTWEDPFVVFDARTVPAETLRDEGGRFRRRLETYLG